MKHCVISVADGIFVEAQQRLRRSLEAVGYAGDLLFWTNALPPGSPDQDASPMAFKPFAFQHAFREGYDAALWLDASMAAIRNLAPIFARTVRSGVYLWGNGTCCGEWASDDILERFMIDREESFRIEEVVSCVVGIAAGHPSGRQFLSGWMEKACDGRSFRGVPYPHPWSASRTNTAGLVSRDPRVKGHRWDQTAASLLAYRYGIPISHLDCVDVIHYANDGWKYVQDLPLTVRLLQNRDFKAGKLREPGEWTRGALARLPRRVLKTARTLARVFLVRGRFGGPGTGRRSA